MAYKFINNRKDFDALDIASIGAAALDFEGWEMVRLVQICNDDLWVVIDFGPKGQNWFASVADQFDQGQVWIAFYSKHEKMCFEKYGNVSPIVRDVANLYKAINGGGHMSLAKLLKWEMDIELDKEQQTSDWDNPAVLSEEQLQYAADDALYTWQVYCQLEEKATDGQFRAYHLFDDMTDAVRDMEKNGMKLDVKHHRTLVAQWEELLAERDAKIRELVNEEMIPNLNSGPQINEFLNKILPDHIHNKWPKTEKTGRLSVSKDDMLQMSVVVGQDTELGQFLTLMSERVTLNKYLSAFGETLIGWTKRGTGGRVHAQYNIAAAITGRFSCSKPNLQQTPRDREFFGRTLSIRKGFVAAPGNLIVSYDYSGIEMRVLALLSGDEQLLHDVIHDDVHGVMAEQVLGRPIDKKNVEDYEFRQKMKGVNFGIIYGIGSLGLAARNGWKLGYAEKMLSTWSKRYPTAWRYRFKMEQEARRTGFITMVDGGTIRMSRREPGLTKCANYPVQRAGLSVMARAIVYHYETLKRWHQTGAKMLSTIHDALIDEAPEQWAEDIMQLMKKDMEQGFLDIFPGASTEGLLEGGMGPSWGELEEF